MTREQAYKSLQNKKIYVGNKNKEIQDKLLECGFKRAPFGLEKYYLAESVKFLYIYDKNFSYGSDMDIFFNEPIELISMKELLDIKIEQEFKDGDYAVSPKGSVFILKGIPTNEKTEYYAYQSVNDNSFFMFNLQWDRFNIERLATKEEINKFNLELNIEGKRWNPDTKKIEDNLKIGDICIFWNDSHDQAVLSKLIKINNNHYYANTGCQYTNVVKAISIEHYAKFIEKLINN